MNLLLDTHAFLWWDADKTKLSQRAFHACLDTQNKMFLSLISIRESQIKVQLGKLVMRLPSLRDVLDDHRRDGLLFIMPSQEDVLGLVALPMIHRDPFDRLLVAQAQRGGFRIVTRDPIITNYDVPVLW